MSKIDLYKGDCLEVMDELIARGVVVDAIIADPPYNIKNKKTTWNNWDSPIDFNILFEKMKLLIKKNGVIALFGSGLFIHKLIANNDKLYKYEWIWKKTQPTGFLNAKKMPLQDYEYIAIFYKSSPTYNPIFKIGKPYKATKGSISSNYCNSDKIVETINNGKRYPTRILEFKRDKGYHPTQKPVALMEYLIKTYTNEGELVLDFTAGSFTTGVACQNTNRDFIGIEMDDNYFKIGSDRMAENKKRIEDTVVEKGEI